MLPSRQRLALSNPAAKHFHFFLFLYPVYLLSPVEEKMRHILRNRFPASRKQPVVIGWVKKTTRSQRAIPSGLCPVAIPRTSACQRPPLSLYRSPHKARTPPRKLPCVYAVFCQNACFKPAQIFLQTSTSCILPSRDSPVPLL